MRWSLVNRWKFWQTQNLQFLGLLLHLWWTIKYFRAGIVIDVL